MEPERRAHPQHISAAVRWAEMTVAHTMVFRGDPLDKDVRRKTTTDLVGRWRGNRPPDWQPSVADVNRLYESVIRWAVEHTRVRLFE